MSFDRISTPISSRPKTASIQARRHWQSIQHLRGFAALIVVVFHLTDKAKAFSPMGIFQAGAHGVDVFFLISGFVMYTAGRNESVGTFYRRRLVRIAPLYWLATMAAVLVHSLLTGQAISRLNLIKSLAFVPFFNPSFDGKIWPLLVPGWTLNYEMIFYALFGLALSIGRPLSLAFVVLPVLVIVGYALPLHNALWQTYTSFLLLDFAAGMIVGWSVEKLEFSHLAPALPVGVVALLFVDIGPLPSFICAGAASIAIVMGALAVEASGQLPDWPLARMLGDASYSLYLVHALVIDLAAAGWGAIGLSTPMLFLPFCVIGFALSLGVGLMTHLFIERPLTCRLRKAMDSWPGETGQRLNRH